MLVGIKPTVGLISRDGIIPITADQDTAGPLTRTVRDAAIVLGVIAGFDPNDPATAACLTPETASAITRSSSTHTRSRARASRCRRFPRTGRGHERRDGDADRAGRDGRAWWQRWPRSWRAVRHVRLRRIIRRPAPRPRSCSTVLNYRFKRDLNQYIQDHVRNHFPTSRSATSSRSTSCSARARRSTTRTSRSSRSSSTSPG
jgi:hypothetical protein